MKKLALAIVMVLAFSSAAFAVAYSDVAVTLSGTNVWTNGKLSDSTAVHNTTFKLSTTDAKNKWKANAEFVLNAATDSGTKNQIGKPTVSGSNVGGAVLTLNDVYIQMTEQPFTFEIWNWGEDGQGADYKTPMEFVWANDAPDANWAARVTTNAGGNDTVFEIKNDGKKPDYFLFTKRNLGALTAGVAYRTNFQHRSILDGWVQTDLGVAKVTGEVAKVSSPAFTEGSKYSLGAKAEFPSNIIITGYVSPAHVISRETYANTDDAYDKAPDKKYFEANIFQLYRASYTIEALGDKKTIDVRGRKKNDQAIADIFNVDNDFFDIAVVGDNDWLKNTGWVAGVNMVITDNVVVSKGTPHTKTVTTVHAGYAPSANINSLAKIELTNVEEIANRNEAGLTKVELRGYYQVNDKLQLHPRYFQTTYEDAPENASMKDTTKFGTYVYYKLVKGMLMGGLWHSKTEGAKKADQIVEFGYELAF